MTQQELQKCADNYCLDWCKNTCSNYKNYQKYCPELTDYLNLINI